MMQEHFHQPLGCWNLLAENEMSFGFVTTQITVFPIFSGSYTIKSMENYLQGADSSATV